MTEPGERRRKMIYIRDEDQEVWADAVAMGDAVGVALSALIAAALADYLPLRAWRAGRQVETETETAA